MCKHPSVFSTYMLQLGHFLQLFFFASSSTNTSSLPSPSTPSLSNSWQVNSVCHGTRHLAQISLRHEGHSVSPIVVPVSLTSIAEQSLKGQYTLWDSGISNMHRHSSHRTMTSFERMFRQASKPNSALQPISGQQITVTLSWTLASMCLLVQS